MLYNGNYLTQAPSYRNAVFGTQTYSGYTGFCTGVVSSADGGSLKVCPATCLSAQRVLQVNNLEVWQGLSRLQCQVLPAPYDGGPPSCLANDDWSVRLLSCNIGVAR